MDGRIRGVKPYRGASGGYFAPMSTVTIELSHELRDAREARARVPEELAARAGAQTVFASHGITVEDRRGRRFQREKRDAMNSLKRRSAHRGMISTSSTTLRSSAPPVRPPKPKRSPFWKVKPGTATLLKIVAPLNFTVAPV